MTNFSSIKDVISIVKDFPSLEDKKILLFKNNIKSIKNYLLNLIFNYYIINIIIYLFCI